MARRPASDFDELAAAFADYGTTLSGYVRYQLARQNLEPYLKGKKLQVLDVGGGSGGDTAWLAQQGHHVTYLEPSAEQRRYAQRRFSFLLDDKSRPRVTVAGATMDDLNPPRQQFDLVLAHTVAMYQADPMDFLQSALRFVKPGGMISIIEKGYYGTELHDVRSNNFTDLGRLQRTGKSINRLNVHVQTFKPEALEQLLVDEKFTVLDWSGIRLVTEDVSAPVDTIDSRRLKTILRLEYEHGHNPAIRGQGQLLHFIGRKKSSRQ